MCGEILLTQYKFKTLHITFYSTSNTEVTFCITGATRFSLPSLARHFTKTRSSNIFLSLFQHVNITWHDIVIVKNYGSNRRQLCLGDAALCTFLHIPDNSLEVLEVSSSFSTRKRGKKHQGRHNTPFGNWVKSCSCLNNWLHVIINKVFHCQVKYIFILMSQKEVPGFTKIINSLLSFHFIYFLFEFPFCGTIKDDSYWVSDYKLGIL